MRLIRQSLWLYVSGFVFSQANPDRSLEFEISSKHVGDTFHIQISVPENHLATESLSVVYVLDGDRFFGLASDVNFAELGNEDVDVIIVGIGYGSRSLNNQKRGRDFNGDLNKPDAGSKRFQSFIKNELFPLLEKKLGLRNQNRTLVGWSRGATFALDTLFEQTELFQNYIVLGPRLNYDSWSMLEWEKHYAAHHNDLNAKVFFAMGSEDERMNLVGPFIQSIQERKYSSFKIENRVIAGHGHTIYAYTIGLGQGLSHLFIKPGIEAFLKPIIEKEGAARALEILDSSSLATVENYTIDERRFNQLGYELLMAKKLEDAILIFQHNVEQYPHSFNVYDSLGEAFMLANQFEKAIKNYQKSLELNPDNSNATQMIQKMQNP